MVAWRAVCPCLLVGADLCSLCACPIGRTFCTLQATSWPGQQLEALPRATAHHLIGLPWDLAGGLWRVRSCLQRRTQRLVWLCPVPLPSAFSGTRQTSIRSLLQCSSSPLCEDALMMTRGAPGVCAAVWCHLWARKECVLWAELTGERNWVLDENSINLAFCFPNSYQHHIFIPWVSTPTPSFFFFKLKVIPWSHLISTLQQWVLSATLALKGPHWTDGWSCLQLAYKAAEMQSSLLLNCADFSKLGGTN